MPQHMRSNSGERKIPKQLAYIESTIKNKVDYDRRAFNSRGKEPQIFYKKDDSKIIYEEGQETYRGPDKLRKQQEAYMHQ